MARRTSSGVYLLAGVGLAFLVIVIVLAALLHNGLPLGLSRWTGGLHLTEEVQQPHVLYSTQLQLSQGTVWKITYDANGLGIEQRGSQLIERLNLSNADLGVDDVVAPVLYDWYLDGNDYVEFDSGPQLGNGEVFSLVASFKPTGKPTTSFMRVFHGAGGTTNWVIDPYQIGWWGANDKLVFVMGNGTAYNDVYSESKVVLGEWYTVSGVAASNEVQIYVNGVLEGYKNRTLDPTATTDTPTIGRAGDVYFEGYVSYVLMTRSINTGQNIVENPLLFISASFTNGTHYFDLVNRIVGTPYGGVARVPAEHPTLFLVKSLASDNYLHLKYVPPGSVFRIKYNGMVYEWRISGSPNQAGLIEDYKIDLAGVFGTTVLPNATIELEYPSEKVRFYVPSGFQVRISNDIWSETHEVPLNSTFVDFGLPESGYYTVQILGYEQEPQVRVETSGDKVRITVTDMNGYALSGAKVYVYEGSNLVAAGTVNDLGFYELDKSQLSSDQLRVVVVALKDGTYYHADKLVTLTSNGTVTVQPVTPVEEAAEAQHSGSSTALVLIIIILLLGIATILLSGKGRRRHLLGLAILALLLTPFFAELAHAEQTYLSWRDTHYDLTPGYRHTFVLSASVTSLAIAFQAGEAYVQAGPLYAELKPNPNFFWGFTYHFAIKINGDEVYSENIDVSPPALGTREVSRSFVVDVDCSGHARVLVGSDEVATFQINGLVDIMKDERDGGRVTVSGTRLYDCSSPGSGGSNGGGNIVATPRPPSSSQSYLDSIAHAFSTATSAALTVLLLGFVGLALFISYKQAKKRKLLVFIPLLFFLASLASPAYAETTNTTTAQKLSFSEEWLKGTVVVVYQGQYGTGWWMNPSYIATAAHVVGYNPSATVTIIRGSVESTGHVVALDRQGDAAIISVDHPELFTDKYVFRLAREMPPPTSTIYVIGYPSELLQVLNNDLHALSEHPRVLETHLTWTASGLIELGGITDAGNSGGPVTDAAGNVIGLVSFALRGPAGTLYFATSVRNLKELAQQHNIAYEEGSAGIIGAMNENPAVAGAIAGAGASLVTDIAILLVGVAIGTGVLHARRRGGRR
ncbi:LamG-like jellyroll fold domain-containing protein [Pyrofollis japonicus]|uniref:LamG-like jellyroll fold domain-containing protein n=1 Tax=Pyrofollis japonicus TaxID=3060460 RepID=UPI00295B31F0|nr:LamG-like jellyroll fold domain-containing protein [Pyrofollis japonicus]